MTKVKTMMNKLRADLATAGVEVVDAGEASFIFSKEGPVLFVPRADDIVMIEVEVDPDTVRGIDVKTISK